jgi:hypothetical protein
MNKNKKNFRVENKEDARQVVAELLLRYGGDAAKERVNGERQYSHQSAQEVAQRAAGNLLTSFSLRRPGL